MREAGNLQSANLYEMCMRMKVREVRELTHAFVDLLSNNSAFDRSQPKLGVDILIL